MTMSNSLKARCFSFFYSHSFRYSYARRADGYKKKKACPELGRRELRPDNQVSNPDSIVGAVILANQSNS